MALRFLWNSISQILVAITSINLPKISCREISENKVTFSKKLKIHPKPLKKLRKEEPETNVYKMLLSCFDKFPGYFEC